MICNILVRLAALRSSFVLSGFLFDFLFAISYLTHLTQFSPRSSLRTWRKPFKNLPRHLHPWQVCGLRALCGECASAA
jgi:hypothetical protein